MYPVKSPLLSGRVLHQQICAVPNLPPRWALTEAAVQRRVPQQLVPLGQPEMKTPEVDLSGPGRGTEGQPGAESPQCGPDSALEHCELPETLSDHRAQASPECPISVAGLASGTPPPGSLALGPHGQASSEFLHPDPRTGARRAWGMQAIATHPNVPVLNDIIYTSSTCGNGWKP